MQTGEAESERSNTTHTYTVHTYTSRAIATYYSVMNPHSRLGQDFPDAFAT